MPGIRRSGAPPAWCLFRNRPAFSERGVVRRRVAITNQQTRSPRLAKCSSIVQTVNIGIDEEKLAEQPDGIASTCPELHDDAAEAVHATMPGAGRFTMRDPRPRELRRQGCARLRQKSDPVPRGREGDETSDDLMTAFIRWITRFEVLKATRTCARCIKNIAASAAGDPAAGRRDRWQLCKQDIGPAGTNDRIFYGRDISVCRLMQEQDRSVWPGSPQL